MSSLTWFDKIYRTYGKKILIIPAILFAVYVYLVFVSPGIKYGMDFRGGILVSFTSSNPVDVEALASAVKTATGATDVTVTPTISLEGGKEKHGAIVEVVYPESIHVEKGTPVTEGTDVISAGTGSEEADFQNRVVSAIKSTVPDASNIVLREVTPTLGSTFWGMAVNVAFWAFMLLLISVVIFFRQWKPTLIMIGSAVYDLLGMLALMALFSIPLNLDTITILLMMVGYSIDTDIVLFTHVLKRGREEGDKYARAARAASTGIHMSGTTLVAMMFIYLVGYLTRNLTVMRIANVMLFGLLSDVIVTWFMNAPITISLVRKNASTA